MARAFSHKNSAIINEELINNELNDSKIFDSCITVEEEFNSFYVKVVFKNREKMPESTNRTAQQILKDHDYTEWDTIIQKIYAKRVFVTGIRTGTSDVCWYEE